MQRFGNILHRNVSLDIRTCRISATFVDKMHSCKDALLLQWMFGGEGHVLQSHACKCGTKLNKTGNILVEIIELNMLGSVFV